MACNGSKSAVNAITVQFACELRGTLIESYLARPVPMIALAVNAVTNPYGRFTSSR